MPSSSAADTPLFPIVNGRYQMDREPLVRIGLVLPEDNKRQVRLRLPKGRWRVQEDPQTIPSRTELNADGHSELTVRTDGQGRVEIAELHAASTDISLVSGAILTLLPLDPPQQPRQGDGVLLREVVAGRGFHWQKLVDQTYTGTLEFRSAPDGNLIVVNELPLEEYLTGVITSEMGTECPEEFMKAQAIAARSWLLAAPQSPHPGQPFHWCNDDCCQRYQGTGGWGERARVAIANCRGEVLITPTNHYCDARYSKSTGGISEDAASVWPTFGASLEGLVAMIDAPEGDPTARFFPITEANIREYLTGDWLKQTQAYASPNVVRDEDLPRYLGRVDEAGAYFRWRVRLTQSDLLDSLSKRGGISDATAVLDIKPIKRGRSGRIEVLEVHYRDGAGKAQVKTYRKEYDIRAAMWTRFLYSSCFVVDVIRRGGTGELAEVELVGGGWGHGAGLCQIGALGRALKGQDSHTISKAYFEGSRVERIYQ